MIHALLLLVACASARGDVASTDPVPAVGRIHVPVVVGPLEGDPSLSAPAHAIILDDDTIACTGDAQVAVARRTPRGTWEVAQVLEPVGGAAAPFGWGSALAAHGDHLFVSVVRHPQFPKPNEVHRFQRDEHGVWQHVGLLLGPAEKGFGTAIATDGEHLVVGQPKPITATGEVSVHALLEGGAIGSGTTLQAPTADLNQEFGSAVAIADGLLLVGARYADRPGAMNAGRVHAWRLEGATWTPEGQPDAGLPEQASGQDWFGYAIAYRGGLLAVGAPGDDSAGVNEGSVRLYRRLGPGSWTFVKRINGWKPHARFGEGVALSSSSLVGVGNGEVVLGSVYWGGCMLHRLDGDPVSGTTLIAYPAAPFGPDLVGFSEVSLSEALVVTAPAVRGMGPAGVWPIAEAALDGNGDGVPNGVEATTGAADCDQNLVPDGLQADCDGNGEPDACLAGGRVDALGEGIGPPGGSGAGNGGSGKDILLLTRHVVSTGDVGDVVGIVTGIRMALEPAATLSVGIWSDPDGDGTPNDATLVRLQSIAPTVMGAGHNIFELPYTQVGPPGTSFFVGITYRDIDFDGLAAHATPPMAGAEWVTSAPAGQLNLKRPASGGPFVTAVGSYARCLDPVMREWQNLDLDAVPDVCECVGDLNGDGARDGADLAVVLAGWETSLGDLDLDGTTGRDDLVILLLSWGRCPS